MKWTLDLLLYSLMLTWFFRPPGLSAFVFEHFTELPRKRRLFQMCRLGKIKHLLMHKCQASKEQISFWCRPLIQPCRAAQIFRRSVWKIEKGKFHLAVSEKWMYDDDETDGDCRSSCESQRYHRRCSYGMLYKALRSIMQDILTSRLYFELSLYGISSQLRL